MADPCVEPEQRGGLDAMGRRTRPCRRSRGRGVPTRPGVPYAAYHRFHEVMAEESAQTVVAALSQHILPLVPGLIDRLARGIDVLGRLR